MWIAFRVFFTNWTATHWLNLGIFLFGGMISTFGITSSTSWAMLPHLFTPLATIGYLVSLLGFLLQTATNRPRDPNVGQRRSDPNPTAPLEQIAPGVVQPVPPVTPGRPLDPEAPKP